MISPDSNILGSIYYSRKGYAGLYLLIYIYANKAGMFICNKQFLCDTLCISLEEVEELVNIMAGEKFISFTKDDICYTFKIKNKSELFTPPTIEEIQAYIDENKFPIDAQRFYNYYDSIGWMVGKHTMQKWKAAVRTWVRKIKENEQGQDYERNKRLSTAAELIKRIDKQRKNGTY